MTTRKKKQEDWTLHIGCVLVGLTTSYWRATKKDKEKTAQVCRELGTTSKWGSLTKRIIDKDELKEIGRICTSTSNYLKGTSPGRFDGEFIPGGLVPWDGKGTYICPNALSQKVGANLEAAKEAFDLELQKLKDRLPSALVEARHESGQLFNEADVPDVDSIIGNKFGFSWTQLPVPHASQVQTREHHDPRHQLSKAVLDRMKDRMETGASDKLEEMAQRSVKTLLDVVGHFAERCEVYDPDKKSEAPFRDNTVDKVRQLVPVIRAMNITNDAQIDKAANDLMGILGNHSAEELRKSGDARADAAQRARKVADNIDKLFS